MNRSPGRLLEPGRMPYSEAIELQRRLVGLRRADEIPDTMILLEHPATYTVGRSGAMSSVLIDPSSLGIELYQVDRGGDATYHGPGQVVGYPILDLRRRGGDVHRYLRDLEEILLRVLADYGLSGERDGRYTGVWVEGQKVAQIGVKVTGGVTSHGFALNVDTNPAHWAGIVPCGIQGRAVTSIAALSGRAPLLPDVRRRIARHAGQVLGLTFRRAAEAA